MASVESYSSPRMRHTTAAAAPSYAKVIEVRGQGFETPVDFSVCRVEVSIVEPSALIWPLDFLTFGTEGQGPMALIRVGEGSSQSDLVFERCLRTMKSGETCCLNFSVPDEDAELVLGNTLQSVAPRAELRLRVTLHSFTSPQPPLWQMSGQQLMGEAVFLKAKGVREYGMKRSPWAFRHFSRAAKLLIAVDEEALGPEDRRTCASARLACYLNLAACQLATTRYEHVIANCDKVLHLDVDNVKALYRRAIACTALQEYDRAAVDLERALALDPHNLAAARQKEIVARKRSAFDRLLGQALGKMFR